MVLIHWEMLNVSGFFPGKIPTSKDKRYFEMS